MAWLFTRYRFSFPINEHKTNKTSSCMLSASTKNNMKTTTQETRCVENTSCSVTRLHDAATGSSFSLCLGSSKAHTNFRSGIILDQNVPLCQRSQGNTPIMNTSKEALCCLYKARGALAPLFLCCCFCVVVFVVFDSRCFPRLRLGKHRDFRENKTNCLL